MEFAVENDLGCQEVADCRNAFIVPVKLIYRLYGWVVSGRETMSRKLAFLRGRGDIAAALRAQREGTVGVAELPSPLLESRKGERVHL